MISGSDQSQNIISEKDLLDVQPSTSSDRLIFIHNTSQSQIDVVQPIIEASHVADNNQVDQVVWELYETIEESVEQYLGNC